MKHLKLLLLFTLLSAFTFGQTTPTLPSGSIQVQTYKNPNGKNYVGNAAKKFEVVALQRSLDSIAALKLNLADSVIKYVTPTMLNLKVNNSSAQVNGWLNINALNPFLGLTSTTFGQAYLQTGVNEAGTYDGVKNYLYLNPSGGISADGLYVNNNHIFANNYEVWHQGNFDPGNYLLRGGDTTTGNYGFDAVTTTNKSTFQGISIGKGNGNYTTNMAVGFQPLTNATAIGTYNTALGHYALSANTDGHLNTGVGVQALFQNTTGSYNLAVGVEALATNSTGVNNTALGGYDTFLNNTTGSAGVAVGYAALYSNTTGNESVAVGADALWHATTGGGNTAIGRRAGYNLVVGNGNIYAGYLAGSEVTTGDDNVYIGTIAGKGHTGSNNIIIGKNAKLPDTTSNNGIQIGSLTSTKARFGNGTTELTVGNIISNGKITFGSGSLAGNTGELFNSASYGTMLGLKTGSLYDLKIVRPNGLDIITVTTGTSNVDFTGAITAGVVKGSQLRVSALNTAPASATATGTLGEIRITSTHIYVCTATNTWVRTALTTW